MKRVVQSLATVALGAAVGFALFLLLARSPLFAGVTILFYRGLLLCAVVAVAVAVLATLALRRRAVLDPSLVIAAAAVSMSLNLAFLIVVPVTIDRSVSVFLLGRIEAAQSRPLDAAGLRRAFVAGYVGDMAQIERRIGEQQRSGTIEVRDGALRITPRGRRFMALARLTAWLFGTDPRFVGG